jgi:hypothetical protein
MGQTRDKSNGTTLQAPRSITPRLEAARANGLSSELSICLERVAAELDTLRALLEITESQLESERCSRPMQRTLVDIERRLGLAAEEIKICGDAAEQLRSREI